MNGIRTHVFGGGDDAVHIQVAVFCRAFPNADPLVRQLHMETVRVLLGIDSDTANPHVAAGADNPDSNLSTVCNQDFVKQDFCPFRLYNFFTRNRG
jgi:hypothetical protein